MLQPAKLITEISFKTAYITACISMFTINIEASALENKAVSQAENRDSSCFIALKPDEQKKLSKRHVIISTKNQANGRRWVTAKIKINAKPQHVWEAVHSERQKDPDLAYSKVLEEGKNESTLEQKFVLLPVVGTSVCVVKTTEIPEKRIDYYLLKSDRFKALEGSWVLMPSENDTTILELGSYIDIGMPVPRSILENITGKKLERRLENVRKAAEANDSKVIAQGKSKSTTK